MSFFLIFLFFIFIFCGKKSDFLENIIKGEDFFNNSNYTNLINDNNKLIGNNSKRKLQEGKLPIRIEYVTSSLENSDYFKSYPEQLKIFNRALLKVNNTIRKLLNVTHLTTITISEDDKRNLNNSGFEVEKTSYNSKDLIVFIKAQYYQESFLSKPGIIKQLNENGNIGKGRPIIGYIILNIPQETYSKGNDIQKEE